MVKHPQPPLYPNPWRLFSSESLPVHTFHLRILGHAPYLSLTLSGWRCHATFVPRQQVYYPRRCTSPRTHGATPEAARFRHVLATLALTLNTSQCVRGKDEAFTFYSFTKQIIWLSFTFKWTFSCLQFSMSTRLEMRHSSGEEGRERGIAGEVKWNIIRLSINIHTANVFS